MSGGSPRLGLALPRLVSRVRLALPQGRTLPDRVGGRRHRALLSLLWLHAAGIPLFRLSRAWRLNEDIRAETREAYDRARESEARKSAILESALDCVITMDHEGRITEFNPAAERTFGYARAEVIGKPMAELIIPPSLRDAHRRGLERYLETGEGPVLGKRIEITAMRADGSEFPVELAITPVDLPEGPLFTGYLRDITERREAEERLREAEMRYRTLVEQLPLATYIELPNESSAAYFSPQIEGLVGYSAEEWVADRSFFAKVLHPDDRARVLDGFAQMHATGEPFECEYRLITRVGQVRWFHDAAVVVRDEAGHPLYTQGYMVDITERKCAEAQLEHLLEGERAQNERLRELDRVKDEFVALVSHELRTPLTSIRGYLELLREEEAGALSSEQRRFLSVVERNAERLQRLVGDLLFVAQVEAGRLALERGEVDLGALAADCLEAARPAAEERGVALTLTREPLPALTGDRARLAQLLDNLVSNALKFTPAGGQVAVRVAGEGDKARLEVEDSGIGIPAAEQERLFERFFRAASASELAIPGSGLGLAIAKAIVEAHGGEIVVTSEEGVGTSFQVELPLDLECEAETELESRTAA